jgi:hypothetical protein
VGLTRKNELGTGERRQLIQLTGRLMLQLEQVGIDEEQWSEAVAYVAGQIFAHAVRTPPVRLAAAITIFNEVLQAWEIPVRLIEMGMIVDASGRPQ